MNPGPTSPEIEERPDGTFATNVSCRLCGGAVVLLSPDRPGKAALGYAMLAVCEGCSEVLDREAKESQAGVQMRERVQLAQMPGALHGLKWTDLRSGGNRDKAIEAAAEWGSGDRRGLLLHGPVGTGKTRIAATAAWEVLKRGRLRWCSVAVLMARLGSSFSDESRRDAISILTGGGPLVLDDLDKVNPSEWARGQLFAAIDRRVSADAKLLVTTNLPPSKLAEKFGDAIASRLIGYCGAYEVDGPDNRLRLDLPD